MAMFKWFRSLFGKKQNPMIGNESFPRRRKDNMCKVCANCGGDYVDGDKYCRFCGAPMGAPHYAALDFACIYGPPPVKRVHTCKKCGYSWTTNLMLDRARWCPQCGGPAPARETETGK